MKYSRILALSAFIISAILPQCAPDGEKKFAAGNKLYAGGMIAEAARKFEEGMISFSAKKSFSDENIMSCDHALYVREAEKIKILYPARIKIKLDAGYTIISFDPARSRTALSNGADIRIFDIEGTPVKIISPVENGNKNIKSILLDNNNIIYYINGIIYTCNIDTGDAKTVTGERFECPFSDTFHSVRFYLSGPLLAAVAGLGGMYNLSVIDLVKNSVLIKNREIASSGLHFTGEDIYFIAGKSGNWMLNHMSIKTNIVRKIWDFTDITDVEFSDAGLLTESGAGMWFFKYESDKPDRVPFDYKLAGGCGGCALLKYKEDSYLTDMKIFRDKLDLLKNTAPLLFSDEKEKTELKL
ncbi:MAG: hypothetical protein MUC95_05465 [Spirochaetes bacterium]|jgi:hypothetical protein|nr:hypothetical protein [Spirochaetota bacterium]